MNEHMAKVIFLCMLLWLLLPAARCQTERTSGKKQNNLTNKYENGKELTCMVLNIKLLSFYIEIKIRTLVSNTYPIMNYTLF